MDTLELKVELEPKDPWSDILIAELSEFGFESFVIIDNGIIAYAPATIDSKEAIRQSSLNIVDNLKFTLTETIIPHKNWNKEWESNFDPVFVDEYATIIAPFHDKKEAKGMVVEIQPQMSFGTGHHQTTWLMTKSMFELDCMPNTALDMGSGTGVLAIVAEKLGAKRVLAIDIEDWSVENCLENVKRNNCENIECICGENEAIGHEKFGLILANINKNILKSHMKSYADALEKDGLLLLSGFFETDCEELAECALNYNLEVNKTEVREGWACMLLRKII